MQPVAPVVVPVAPALGFIFFSGPSFEAANTCNCDDYFNALLLCVHSLVKTARHIPNLPKANA